MLTLSVALWLKLAEHVLYGEVLSWLVGKSAASQEKYNIQENLTKQLQL